MKFELKKLLLNGHFGSIRLGDSPQKVVRLLGKADDCYLVNDDFQQISYKNSKIQKFTDAIKLANNHESSVLIYGAIEMWFSLGKLTYLYSDHFDVKTQFKKNCYFDPWIIKKGFCIRDFIDNLEEEKIKYSIFQYMTVKENERAYEIHLSPNTYLLFSNEAIISGYFEDGKLINEVKYPSCCELVGFYWKDSKEDPRMKKYLTQITDLQELVS